MRHLFLPACICLMTLSGAASADEIPSQQLSASKAEGSKAPASVADAPAGASPEQGESTEPKAGAAENLPVAADVPIPVKRPPPVKDRVVARSHHEICTSVAEFGVFERPAGPVFHSSSFSGKSFQAGCCEPCRRPGHCAIHAGDRGDRRSQQSV